jgi:hypothetical protein
LEYSVDVGDKLGDVPHKERCSILEKKRNQICPFSEISIKLVSILTWNKLTNLKNFKKYFDPKVLM